MKNIEKYADEIAGALYKYSRLYFNDKSDAECITINEYSDSMCSAPYVVFDKEHFPHYKLIKKWLLEDVKYELTQFEFDVIRVYIEIQRDITVSTPLDDIVWFKAMRRDGYFKHIPSDAIIKDILNNYEIIE